MRILLTGANGLVGQKIKEALAGIKEIKLIATSRNEEINKLREEYIFEKLDITDQAQISGLFAKHQPEVLINSAAQASANFCEKDKINCWKINTEAVENLTDYCNKNNTHLIQLSTDFVFNGNKPEYQEEDYPEPVNYYGVTKKEAENHILQHAVNWSIIRTILVYGYFNGMKKQNIVTWVISSLKNKQSIKIVNDQYRTPTFAEDLAETIKTIAFKKKYGLFHVAGSEVFSISEIAYQVAKYFNLDSKMISEVSSAELKEPAIRPSRTKFNLLKAEQELNYRPHSFQQGLELIEQQLNNEKY